MPRPSKKAAALAYAHLAGPAAAEEQDEDRNKARGRRAENDDDDDTEPKGSRAEDDDDQGDDAEPKSRKAKGGQAEEGDEEEGDDADPKGRRTAAAEDDDDDEEEREAEEDDRDPKARAARKRERARCAAIFGSKHAAGRVAAAANLAFTTKLTASQAISVLKTLPGGESAEGGDLGTRMQGYGGHRPAASAPPQPSGRQAVTTSWDAAATRAGIRKR